MKQFILITIFAFFLLGCSQDPPKPATPQTSPPEKPPVTVPQFDGANAFKYLTAQTDFGPRNPNSNGHENCLRYLQSEMQKYADAVNLQSFTQPGYKNETLKLTNVISSFNMQSTSRILLVSHWDTRPMADQESLANRKNKPILGANDAASGIAILIEMARHFKTNPPPVGVDMLFVDGEDYGNENDLKNYFLGARYFAKHKPVGYAPMFAILLDMVGDKQLEIKREPYSIRFAPDIVNLVWSTARDLGVYQFADGEQRPTADDHLPLNEAGIKTIDLIDFDYPDETNKYWHTLEDTPDKCSPESLEAVGKVLLTVIYRQQ